MSASHARLALGILTALLSVSPSVAAQEYYSNGYGWEQSYAEPAYTRYEPAPVPPPPAVTHPGGVQYAEPWPPQSAPVWYPPSPTWYRPQPSYIEIPAPIATFDACRARYSAPALIVRCFNHYEPVLLQAPVPRPVLVDGCAAFVAVPGQVVARRSVTIVEELVVQADGSARWVQVHARPTETACAFRPMPPVTVQAAADPAAEAQVVYADAASQSTG